MEMEGVVNGASEAQLVNDDAPAGDAEALVQQREEDPDRFPRLCVSNFGKWSDKNKMRKFLLTVSGLKFRNVHKNRQDPFGFITFDSAADRDVALPVLQAAEWKGKPLEVNVAMPKKSFGSKRKLQSSHDSSQPSSKKAFQADEEGQSSTAVAANVVDSVTPWHSVPYTLQLAQKEAEMRRVLIKIMRSTRKEYVKKLKGPASGKGGGDKSRNKADNNTKHLPIPSWLESGGSIYKVNSAGAFRMQKPENGKAGWVRVGEGASLQTLCSFSGVLLGLTNEGEFLYLDEYGENPWKWKEFTSLRANNINAFTSHLGKLHCVTEDAKLCYAEYLYEDESFAWKTVGAVSDIISLASHSSQLLGLQADGTLVRIEIPSGQGDGDLQIQPLGNLKDCTSIMSHTGDLVSVHGATLNAVEASSLSKSSTEDGELPEMSLKSYCTVTSASDGDEKTLFADHTGLCCPVARIKSSPEQIGYRNKCEFTIGYDDEQKPCVGFRCGLYTEGSVTVQAPRECLNVPEPMKDLCDLLKTLILESELPPYDRLLHKGVWRTLTLRSSKRTQMMMALVQVNPSGLSDEQLESIEKMLADKFTGSISEDISVTSLFIQYYDGLSSPTADHPVKHLWGEDHITEELLGLKFRVSPGAFFQVNTEGAEILYRVVGDQVALTSETTVYDVCCGTGTIGLSIASEAKKVIGVELCKAATDDAVKNAELNDITNAEFLCSKAEDVMDKLLKQYAGHHSNRASMPPVVAIVDPPRSGLHQDCLRALRGCSPIQKIVYVSCNPTGSLIEDVKRLCGPSTNHMKGEAFMPTGAIPVDMFPHTPHCEMVLVLERYIL